MCCGASWSWGWHGRASACLAAAYAGTVAIFYYPWYGTPAQDGAWQHWSQNSHRPPERPLLALLPGARSRTRAATRPSSSSRWREIAPRASTRSSLVVGARLDGGRAAAARPRRRAAPPPAVGDPPRAVRRPLAGDDAARSQVPRRARRAGRLRLPPARLRGGRLGGAAARRFRRRCVCSPGQSSSASPPRAASTASTRTTSCNFGGGEVRRGSARQAHAVHLALRAERRPRLRRRARRRGARPLAAARNGATYDNLWTAALAAKPDIVTITSYNEWGEGHADRGGARRAAATAATTAPGACVGTSRPERLSDAHGVLGGAASISGR